MPLTTGDKLGPYEILSAIGAGGMGAVFRARDTRLNRDVAIKVSTGRFSERFEREARAVAALNHPNICHLHDIGEGTDGAGYLVMEYIEGSPIAPVDSARKLLDLAVQIADGLSAAHAAGIVHRDLKPDNILLTREGRVKILDFGIAKMAEATTAGATLAMTVTDPGTTLGTINYMSPEQARGLPNLGPQSDHFSLGVVLYELVAGTRPFIRPSAAETMTAIIREDAEPLPQSAPAPLRWIIERLLSKDPAERYDSTRDLYRELRQIRDRYSESSSVSVAVGALTAPPATRPRRSLAFFATAAIALAAGAVLALLLFPAHPADLASYKFTPLSRRDATERYPTWSPDGKSIAFTLDVHGIDQIFTKPIDSPDAVQLTRSPDPCYPAFWSHDGSTIYYSSASALWSVPASGGPPEKRMDRVGPSASLHPDGKTVLFSGFSKVFVGSLEGGDPREFRIPSLGEGRFVLAWFAPDGANLAVLHARSLWIVKYPSGAARKMANVSAREISWLPDSRRLVYAERAPSQNRLALLDTYDGSVRVLYASHEGMFNPAISPDGKRLAYASGPVEWDAIEISVPSAQVQTVMAESGVNSIEPDWHPSGTHFLVATNRSGTTAIEDVSAAGGFSRRVQTITTVSGPNVSPDGARFVFGTNESGRIQLRISSIAGGLVTPVDPDAQQPPIPAWSPDGQWLVYGRTHQGKFQLVKRHPGSAGDPVVMVHLDTPLDDLRVVNPALRWSPAGDWILFPRRDGMWLVSPDGKLTRKLSPRAFQIYGFSKDGAQVIGVLRDTTGKGAQWALYSVDVRTGAEKLLGPIELPPSTDSMRGFSMHPDGKRFLTSIAKWPFDIWMLEGFDAPPKSLLDRLLRR